MNEPLISIIVPNYNHEAFLRQRLDSIFNQTYRNFEVILLDDNSTDASLQVLNDYATKPEVVGIVQSEINSGSPFKQWRRGLSMAKGQFVWIAESDDYCELSFLEELIAFNTANNNMLDIIYAQSMDIDDKGNHLASRLDYTKNITPNIWESDFVIDGAKFIANYLKIKCVIPNASAVIFKREIALDNPFSESHLNMKMCGDWLYWLMLCKDAKIGFVSQALNFFRVHEGVSRNHSDLGKKYQRCLEEKFIRIYLTSQFAIDQEKEVLRLYNRWFRANELWRLAFPKFYKIRLKETSRLGYVKQYFKINKIAEKLTGKKAR